MGTLEVPDQHLAEMLLMSNHNICFHAETRKQKISMLKESCTYKRLKIALLSRLTKY